MSKYKYIMIVLLFLLLQGAVLFILGQPAICTCGYVKIWEGVVRSLGNSQHLSDWYSFSHIIHGLVFYFLLGLIFPRLPRAHRFLIALGLEASWEILENTPWVINAYRQQALAQGYNGDSVINSLSDTLFMIFGFGLAVAMPVWFTVLLGLGLEIWVGYFIHDNLALNILNFIYKFEFIQRWQSGG